MVDVLSVIVFLVIGLIVGWLADVVVKGISFGLLGDMVIGIIGALIGGLVFSFFGIGGGFWVSLIAAFVGAVILLVIIRAIQTPARPRRNL